jgi:hypothetical protein
VSREPFSGPVVADLAAKWTPGIAQMDARHAAAILAGAARDVAELREWLMMTGLLPAPPYWAAGAPLFARREK